MVHSLVIVMASLGAEYVCRHMGSVAVFTRSLVASWHVESSQMRGGTHVPCLAGDSLTTDHKETQRLLNANAGGIFQSIYFEVDGLKNSFNFCLKKPECRLY